MPLHIWIAWIILGIAAVLGVLYAIVKWLYSITIERDLEEFHEEMSVLAAKACETNTEQKE